MTGDCWLFKVGRQKRSINVVCLPSGLKTIITNQWLHLQVQKSHGNQFDNGEKVCKEEKDGWENDGQPHEDGGLHDILIPFHNNKKLNYNGKFSI